MTPKDNISAELMQLSPLLAGIPKVNVYQVPESYFETLGINLLLIGSTEALPASLGLSPAPEGYFENLPSLILETINESEVVQETRSISSIVAEVGNQNVFTAPVGYFENLSENILGLKKSTPDVETESHLLSISKDNVFSAPTGYFDHLSSNILARIHSESTGEVVEETLAISELVAGIGKGNIFSVPQDYFSKLAGEVLIKTTHQQEGKLVAMKSRFTSFKYAVAAAIIGILGFSLFFMLNRNETPSNTTSETMMAAKEIIKTNSFENELNSISDAAIVNFLEAKGEDVEAALVASLVDEKDLPDATDYLINDNTLDEILKTVELSN